VRKKPRAGTCALNGKMVLQSGSSWRILRKATQLKLLSMLLQRACLKPLLLCGGPHMCSRIIDNVTSHYHKRTHNFGTEVLKSWDDCVRLDKENDNTLWQEAVRKEMKNFRTAFKILNGE
jgi:hypothetical protein